MGTEASEEGLDRGGATFAETEHGAFRTADGAKARPGRAKGAEVVRMVSEPLEWYFHRGLISREQFTAGDRLRSDHYQAFGSGYSSPRVDANAGIRAAGGRASGPMVLWEWASLYKAALAALSGDQSAMVEAVCCHGEYAKPFATRKGWQPRSGIATLRAGLTSLADHYREAGAF